MQRILSSDDRPDGRRISDSWIRPIKCAYLIPDDDISAVLRAIESSCVSWGGFDHIFVPVGDGSVASGWLSIVERYDPDVFVDMADLDTAYRERLASKGQYVHEWKRPFTTCFIPGALLHSATMAFRDMFPANLRVLIPVVSENHPLRLPILAKWGALNEDGIDEVLETHGIARGIRIASFGPPFAVSSFSVDFTREGAEALVRPPSHLGIPLSGAPGLHGLANFTSGTYDRLPPAWPPYPLFQDDERHEPQNRERSKFSLITGRHDSVSDLCLYWTLRANRPDSVSPFPLWIPLDELATPDGQAALALALSSQRTFPPEREVLYVLSSSAGADEIEAALGAQALPREIITSGFEAFVPYHFWRGLRSTDVTMFDRGDAHIRVAQTDRIAQFAGMDRIAHEVEVSGVLLPQIPTLRYSIPNWRITRRGFERSMYCAAASPVEAISLPSSWYVLQAIFDQAGLACSPSDKGRLALGVLHLIGGVSDLFVLGSSKIYDLLVDMAKRKGSRSRKSTHDESASPNAVPFDELKHALTFDEIERVLGKSAAARITQWLVLRRIVFRGARLSCSVCGFARWYAIDDFGTSFRCDGCRTTSETPLRHGSTHWRYRLNELYARAFDQGALVHLLLAYQRTGAPARLGDELLGFYPGVQGEARDGAQREFDWVEIRGGRLYVGECKVNARDLDAQQADDLAAASRRLGCEQFLIASLDGALRGEAVAALSRHYGDAVVVYDRSHLLDRNPWDTEQQSPSDYIEAVNRRLSAFDV